MSITLQPGEQRQLNVPLTPIPPAGATLYGYVKDAVTGAAIVGAVIQLTGPYQYSDTTDGAGYYQITEIVPGTYSGMVSAGGYQSVAF